MSKAPMVQVDGSKELRKTMKRAGEDFADLKAVHEAAGQIVVDAARGLAPVVSGALAGSIRASRLANGVSVKVGGNRIPYANPIHWGWPKRNIAGVPFLSDAATQTEPIWLALYEAEMERIIEKIKGDNE